MNSFVLILGKSNNFVRKVSKLFETSKDLFQLGTSIVNIKEKGYNLKFFNIITPEISNDIIH
jgi:hypothetical protein